MEKANPEDKRKSSREHYWRNRERIRSQQNKRHRDMVASKFGVEYPTWWLCDICNMPISLCRSEIKLDHDHKTNKFRGWLCHSCNIMIGYIEKFEQMEKTVRTYLAKSMDERLK